MGRLTSRCSRSFMFISPAFCAWVDMFYRCSVNTLNHTEIREISDSEAACVQSQEVLLCFAGSPAPLPCGQGISKAVYLGISLPDSHHTPFQSLARKPASPSWWALRDASKSFQSKNLKRVDDILSQAGHPQARNLCAAPRMRILRASRGWSFE